MSGAVPRRVFRVMYIDGSPKVVERVLVSRRGSWFTTQDGSGALHRENGNYWSDTVSDAIATEAWYLMNRFCLPQQFRQSEQVRHMQELLDESFRWGELVGMVNANSRGKQRAEAATNEQGG